MVETKLTFEILRHSKTGSHPHLQDPREIDERGERHSIRAIGPTLPEQHRRRDKKRVHGGRHVCHQIEKKGSHRKRFPRGNQQGDQGLREIQLNAKIHDLQLD